jgi:hypothetical protein
VSHVRHVPSPLSTNTFALKYRETD